MSSSKCADKDPQLALDLSPEEVFSDRSYSELRRLATVLLARERPNQILQPTALVHEAWVRISESFSRSGWKNCRQVIAVMATTMRRILIDEARRKRAEKHGGEWKRVHYHETLSNCCTRDDKIDDLLSLEDAIKELETIDPLSAKLVELRYFAGLTQEEAASTLEMTNSTAKRKWIYARSWLSSRLSK